MAFLAGRRVGTGGWRNGSGNGSPRFDRRHLRRGGRDAHLTALDDLDLFFALGDLELGDAGLLDEVNQLLQLAQVHARALTRFVLVIFSYRTRHLIAIRLPSRSAAPRPSRLRLSAAAGGRPHPP